MQETKHYTHDEKQNYGSQISSLLTSAFITDPEFHERLALLDTPGYTKPEDNDYSQRTDESVAAQYWMVKWHSLSCGSCQ